MDMLEVVEDTEDWVEKGILPIILLDKLMMILGMMGRGNRRRWRWINMESRRGRVDRAVNRLIERKIHSIT